MSEKRMGAPGISRRSGRQRLTFGNGRRRLGRVQETALPPDALLVERLRAGDDAAFAALLDAWSSGMHRVARGFVATADSADEVVQDTWLAVIQGLAGLRGTLLAEDLGLPDPRQHGPAARRAGEPDGAVEQPHRRRRGADRRPVPVPRARSAVRGSLDRLAAALAGSGGRDARRRGAGPRRRRGGRAARAAAGGASRCATSRGTSRRGLRDPGDLGGQPARSCCTAPARPCAGGWRATSRRCRHDRAAL